VRGDIVIEDKGIVELKHSSQHSKSTSVGRQLDAYKKWGHCRSSLW